MARGNGPKKKRPQISPLRCAPVEMTKGGEVMARGNGPEKRDRGYGPSMLVGSQLNPKIE